MTDDQARLREKFLATAMQAKRDSGAPDNFIVGSMLAAAHSFALRRDPTQRYIDRIFDPEVAA